MCPSKNKDRNGEQGASRGATADIYEIASSVVTMTIEPNWNKLNTITAEPFEDVSGSQASFRMNRK
jgi:hypothetical protein